MNRYKVTKQLGDGTYGSVLKAVNRSTHEVVAIKKMKKKFYTWEECMQLREVNSLKKLNHPNIVKLKEVIRENDELFFVFEFMEANLYEITKNRDRSFPEARIRNIVYQLLQGLAFMHKHGFFHRDIKPENMLVKGDTVKIADFGLAREIRSRPPYTDYVSTRWYRAPELLLGQRLYSTGVDVWSLGCIMGELLCKDPLFQGKTEIDQIDRIFRLLGTPNEKIWPNFINLPSVRKIKFPHQPYNNLRKKFPKISPNGGVTLSDAGFDLLNKLLAYDPGRRMTCEEALGHEFFREFPPAKAKELMPTYPSKAAGQTREVVERAKAAARARNAELRAIEAMEGEDPLEGMLDAVVIHLERLEAISRVSDDAAIALASGVQACVHLLALGGYGLPLQSCCRSGAALIPPIGEWDWRCSLIADEGLAIGSQPGAAVQLNPSELALLQRLPRAELPRRSDGELMGPVSVWLRLLAVVECWIRCHLPQPVRSLGMLREALQLPGHDSVERS